MASIADQLRRLADQMDSSGSSVVLTDWKRTFVNNEVIDIELRFKAFPKRGYTQDEGSGLGIPSRAIKPPIGWIAVDNHIVLHNYDENFYVSYNSNVAGIGGDGTDETALVRGERYYILNGDFRSLYEAVIDEGWQACIGIFLAYPNLHSSWTNDYEAES